MTVSVNQIAKTMLETFKQGYLEDAFHEIVHTQYPLAFLRDYNEAADLAWKWFREEVAEFAAWSAGSCHGDANPECYRAWRDVMEHDFEFGVQANKYWDYLQSRQEAGDFLERISA